MRTYVLFGLPHIHGMKRLAHIILATYLAAPFGRADSPSDGDAEFVDVGAARIAFIRFHGAFRGYSAALRATGLSYNTNGGPIGPPFDMWYHMEILDRLLDNFSKSFDESVTAWQSIGLDADDSEHLNLDDRGHERTRRKKRTRAPIYLEHIAD